MDLEILKIASSTENHKILNDYTHHSKLKNPICGDEMQINIKIVKNKIYDFGYQCKSCVYCQASASLLSTLETLLPGSPICLIIPYALALYSLNLFS